MSEGSGIKFLKEISILNIFDVVKLGAVAAHGAMPATIFSPNKAARRRVEARRQA